jgi:adenylate cyclase
MEVGSNVLSAVLPALTWAPRLLVILLLLGFPIVLVLAWIFDIGPGGIQRTAAIGEPTRAAPTFTSARPVVAPRNIEIVEEAPKPERVRQASLAFVRHELRTPINAIIGYSEMLLEDARDGGDGVVIKDLERIVECAREINTLVDSILDPERSADDYDEQIRAHLRDPLSAIVGYTEMLLENAQDKRDLERILTAANRLFELSNDITSLAKRAPNATPIEMSKAGLAEGVLSKIRAVQQNQVDREGALLVVDDSPLNRDLLAKQLARKGYVVATAENGRAALEILAEQTFDLVLLDVLMPEMDGIEVLRRMKGDAALCALPVIMISALDEIDSIVRCLEIGAADFVSKPFHPTLLDARIQATLAAQRVRNAPLLLDGGLERLMIGTFPSYVVKRVREGDSRLLDSVPNAAAYFVDLDQAVASADARERASKLELLIATAHDVTAQHGASVLLQGIGLLMAAGFPEATEDAAERIARVALAFSRDAEARGMRIRSAIHVGALCGALVGSDQLSYSVWGDAVDLSRRMALGAERGQIMVSAACHNLIKDSFALTSRGVIEVAGRGQLRAYVLQNDAVPAT